MASGKKKKNYIKSRQAVSTQALFGNKFTRWNISNSIRSLQSEYGLPFLATRYATSKSPFNAAFGALVWVMLFIVLIKPFLMLNYHVDHMFYQQS